MALVVEDGTGKATAESYISVTDAGTYHSNRGNTGWAAITTDALKEAALRKATDYMVQIYTGRWQGCKVDASVQALDWPRYDVYVDDELVDDNIVPTAVKNACAELALKAATANLLDDLEQGVLSETVGPISVTYDNNSPQTKRYKAVDAMLAPYLKSGGSGISMGLLRV